LSIAICAWKKILLRDITDLSLPAPGSAAFRCTCADPYYNAEPVDGFGQPFARSILIETLTWFGEPREESSVPRFRLSALRALKAVRSSTSPSLDGQGQSQCCRQRGAPERSRHESRRFRPPYHSICTPAWPRPRRPPGVGTDHAFGRSVLYYVGWVDSLVSVRSAITVEASVPARPTAERRFRNGHGFALK
jgi:hypothetical protein